MSKRSTSLRLQGNTHAKRKLTPEIVRQIRAYREDGHTMLSIATLFSIHLSTVKDILSRQTWKHVA